MTEHEPGPIDNEPTRPEVDAQAELAFDLCAKLCDTLVLCPSYGPVEDHTSVCLDWMRGLGAVILHTSHCADLALHRSLLASMAYDALTGDGAHASDRKYVLWLDSDVAISQAELRVLFEDQDALAEAFPDLAPAVSARYLAKLQDRLDARHLPDRQTFAGPHGRLQPVLAGMGCLLMTRVALLRHCLQSIAGKRRQSGKPLYYICNPGVRFSASIVSWYGEDRAFCEAHWAHCAGVYLSVARAMHSRTVLVLPKEDDWFISPESVEPPPIEANAKQTAERSSNS